MSLKILIVQSDPQSASQLSRDLKERGDQVVLCADPAEALAAVEAGQPDLVMLDLHFPGNGWLDFLRNLRSQFPAVRVLITNKHPDLQREHQAREQGARVFLREPFNRRWIDQAIRRLDEEAPAGSISQAGASEPPAPASPKTARIPSVRVPVRMKITLPYAILALAFALIGAFIVGQMVLDSVQSRFNDQLTATGKRASDWVVREENRELETLRLLANLTGMAEAIQKADAESLRQLVLPIALNSGEEAVEILDGNGMSVLSLRHKQGGAAGDYTSSRGETLFSQWDFVHQVLLLTVDKGRDKFSGTVDAPWGRMFYVSGPLLASDGTLAGVVMVGRRLDTIVKEIHAETQAEISLYDLQGKPIVSSLYVNTAENPPVETGLAARLLGAKDKISLMRDLNAGDTSYRETLGVWEVRDGQNVGLLGIAEAQVYLVKSSQATQIQVFLLVAGAFLLVIIVGVTLANQITRPLLKVVRASSEVAEGNLEVKVDPKGNDEVAILAHTFNYMVAGLQEGSMYRDLLGRTVSPEVREQLRQTFTSGNLRLEGQEAVATVMMSDIRGFTPLSERVDPATVFKWLNEYFGELVPIIAAGNGVVNKFDGDAILAFFGILPRLLEPQQSAFAACKAAIEMLQAVESLNVRRVERGEPPLATGIGLNTGMITAGGIGTLDRLHYTIIGDTVNTTQRLESLTREVFSSSGVVISHSTYLALGEYRLHFKIDPLGSFAVKGKAEQLMVYRLLPLPEVGHEADSTAE